MKDFDRIFSDLFTDFDRFTIGLRPSFDQIRQAAHNYSHNGPGYPPHDLIQIDDKTYQISLAVAGFTEKDIEIKLDGKILSVSSVKTETDTDANAKQWIHRGVSNRHFVKKFYLDEYIEVGNVSLEYGMLTITLTRNVPEKMLPKVIPINSLSLVDNSK